eukprot:TRINITY_DN44908_c0_g1_i1.p1 TRINITY_DN44908_c0_g1~~TRINITY_DN44908_c0_g1_i1.p1  ORF type:complete len:522 (+),score=70.49 TRINITY_DN44908_c0_g1_i1:73-1638(+)
MARIPRLPQKLVAEAIGTFVIALVWSSGSKVVWLSAVADGAAVVALMYALISVSGGNFNPAVTVGLWCSDVFFAHGDMPCLQAILYVLVQIVAGVLGSLAAAGISTSKVGELTSVMLPDASGTAKQVWPVTGGHAQPGSYLGPQGNHNLFDVFAVEAVYCGIVVFVYLNCATCRDEGRLVKNYYSPLAVGGSMVASSAALAHISRCALNPAIAAGASFVSMIWIADNSWEQFGIFWVYFAAQIIGAVLASLCFFVCRKDSIRLEEQEENAEAHGFVLSYQISLISKCASEFFGSFNVVLTFLLTLIGTSKAGLLGIASVVLASTYAVGPISGGNFNPAISFGLLISRMLSLKEFGAFVVAQVLGMFAAIGIASAFDREWKIALVVENTSAKNIADVNGSLGAVFGGETVFTFVLVFLFLNLIADMPNQHYGVALFFCILAGMTCVGEVTGGLFNPLVALAIDFGGWVHGVKGGRFGWSFMFLLIHFLAAALAAGVFCAVRIAPQRSVRKQMVDEESWTESD